MQVLRVDINIKLGLGDRERHINLREQLLCSVLHFTPNLKSLTVQHIYPSTYKWNLPTKVASPSLRYLEQVQFAGPLFQWLLESVNTRSLNSAIVPSSAAHRLSHCRKLRALSLCPPDSRDAPWPEVISSIQSVLLGLRSQITCLHITLYAEMIESDASSSVMHGLRALRLGLLHLAIQFAPRGYNPHSHMLLDNIVQPLGLTIAGMDRLETLYVYGVTYSVIDLLERLPAKLQMLCFYGEIGKSPIQSIVFHESRQEEERYSERVVQGFLRLPQSLVDAVWCICTPILSDYTGPMTWYCGDNFRKLQWVDAPSFEAAVIGTLACWHHNIVTIAAVK
ncbi:hypothetical protein M408DRAFT_98535 [Serendipita vermifera MAFF 305830]|uniref:Uncharacterized protein n=1 Tax=Serendipita vermifera MAFF 305830 TaxID=933852 RepID=A0A0C3BCP5_SERVB|nr:hypothetical protein M408DRAFT_98535 [Serendipita vermifera MAFF 305830]